MYEVLMNITNLLKSEGIDCCFVGELALNYYNVPRVIHEVEICVSAESLERALEVFADSDHALQQVDPPEVDVFTEFKSECARFRASNLPKVNVVLLSDVTYGFKLCEATLRTPLHDSDYSKEILSVLTPAEVADLPFPTLQHFFGGLCQAYRDTDQTMFAMAAEQLVDGMNINPGMCVSHLDHISPEARDFATELAASRRERIDYFSDNIVTCFVAKHEDVEKLLHIPGHFKTVGDKDLHQDCCAEEAESGLSPYSAANWSDEVETDMHALPVSDLEPL